MKKYYADRKSLNLLRVVVFVLLVAIIFGLKYLLYWLEQRYPDYFIPVKTTIPEIIIWSVIILLAAAYVLYILIYLPLWYNSINYYVSDSELISVSGLFMKSRKYMRLSSVLYVTSLSAPLARYTSFNFLVMSAHGGRMMFMFLSQADIEEISRFILNDIKNREQPLPDKKEKEE